MLKHIVMWKLKDNAGGRDKAANAALIKSRLEALAHQIAEITHLEVGVDESHTSASYDLVLYSEFKDSAALETYRVHPAHVEVAELIGPCVIERKVVDYVI